MKENLEQLLEVLVQYRLNTEKLEATIFALQKALEMEQETNAQLRSELEELRADVARVY